MRTASFARRGLASDAEVAEYVSAHAIEEQLSAAVDGALNELHPAGCLRVAELLCCSSVASGGDQPVLDDILSTARQRAAERSRERVQREGTDAAAASRSAEWRASKWVDSLAERAASGAIAASLLRPLVADEHELRDHDLELDRDRPTVSVTCQTQSLCALRLSEI